MPINKSSIINRLEDQKGRPGFYFKNLVTGETAAYNENDAYLAASVIKLPIFMELSRRDAAGTISMNDRLVVRNSDKVPICGALTLFTDEPECDIRTLCNLMISLSDNTATNKLISFLGIDEYNKGFAEMGLKVTKLRRMLYDSEAGAKGLENEITPKEMGMLLEQVYDRTFVNAEVSKKIEDTLMEQQINHKIPGRWREDIPCAHKTGEDDNITNDVALVYAKQPFILCFTGTDVDVPDYEDLIRHVSEEILNECNR
jgi:Beta-lactamase class A